MSRADSLLEGVLAVASGLELQEVLRRIVEVARTLVDAEYGALGTIGPDGKLSDFIHVGMDAETIKRIGALPKGKGLVGLLIAEPKPLRLDELGSHHASYGFPPNHPPMHSFLGVPIRLRDQVFGNLYLTEKRGGGHFSAEDEATAVALAGAAGVAIENARLFDATRNRERWLAATTEVTTSLLSGTDPEDVLALVARKAREMADADLVTIALPGTEPGTLVLEITEGDGAEVLAGLAVPIDRSLTGTVFTTGEPEKVDDLHTDVRAADVLPQVAHIGPCLYIPLGGPGHVRGVLRVGNQAGRPGFGTEILPMLTAFAGQATIALELAERRRDVERLSVLEDRDRIARDLHDLVIQRLFATGMVLEGASRLIVRPEVASRVRKAVDDLDQTIKEIRATIFALQMPTLDDQPSLRGRVVATVDAAAPSLGFAPSLHLDGLIDTTVPAGVADHLVAALREALSNAARHAHASRVSVLVAAEASDVLLRVTDDGVGLPEGGRRSGLRNLADRAAELGGTFTAGPGPGSGTELTWRVPISDLVVSSNDD